MSTATKNGDPLLWVLADDSEAKGPKWKRSACIDGKGNVFAPAWIIGNETRAMLCASWDGNVPVVMANKHIYLPVRWMAKECPDMADICELIERRVKEIKEQGS